MRHTEPDRDGDFAHGLRVALAAEAVVVAAIFAAAVMNIDAIFRYFDRVAEFFY